MIAVASRNAGSARRVRVFPRRKRRGPTGLSPRFATAAHACQPSIPGVAPLVGGKLRRAGAKTYDQA